MPGTLRRKAQSLALAFGVLFLCGHGHGVSLPPGAILGWWHGSSTCVHESSNSACKDEIVQYEFAPTAADSTHTMLHAFRLVGGDYEPMGDLPFVYAADSQPWHGDFANGRVDIRWPYHVVGDTLRRQLFLRPAMRVARNVVAWRGKDNSRHSAPHN